MKTASKLFFNLAVVLVLSQFAFVQMAEADAPVFRDSQYVSADTPEPAVTGTESQLTIGQRVQKLEQQMANQQQMGLLKQIQQLQQEVRDLRGQVELQTYDLKRLSQQQKNDYSDLDSRVTKSVEHKPGSTTLAPSDAMKLQAGSVNTTQASGLSVSSSAVKGGGSFLEEQNVYESAYGLLSKKKYTEAITSMQSYLKQFPSGTYAPNAHYWLGELYLLKGNDQGAITEFETVIANYPTNQKVRDAILKLGFIYYDNDEFAKAKEELVKVKTQYPGTTAAQLATSKIRDIEQQPVKQ